VYIKGIYHVFIFYHIVVQLLAHGQWFSPAASTTKTGLHDIAEILLKVGLNTKNQKFVL
jgi:hypothetical protein